MEGLTKPVPAAFQAAKELPQAMEANTSLPTDAAQKDLLNDKFTLGPRKVGETSMRRHLCIAAIWALILVFLTLVACGVMVPAASPQPGAVVILGTPVESE